ncbi:peptide chain release factor H [Myroides odoratimimus]|uniref:peptide chain release factor H n=1 Tax=Myroides odoratimimus TaxID=76832 RepID=UPI00103C1E7B|nr:peptide chain release factor H [Myroides odoratimimus]MCA4791936.1 peptide chain release factor H [Myroides odoratimimus]MCA4805860.1 peptide chain release factor H [Myroides odoratimimus]MCA4819401.1 peptide chain release factor H [Myroides odoratimimus]MDM1060479.1 peptide chain release factor H [Myroides odoratimimus]MDM1399761.1 peptide chain release factor H [Myroides odoratimimus]
MATVIQITSGRGPQECDFAVKKIAQLFIDDAVKSNIKVNPIQDEADAHGASVFIQIVETSKEVDTFLRTWLGTIQWICESPFRPKHKRKNWYIGIFESTKASDPAILDRDIQYQAVRSSGAGGQNVNKVSSAVRATHLPTGITVLAMDSRSQHQNKKLATERILDKLQNMALNEVKLEEKNTWLNQTKVERGNPTRTFIGIKFREK